MTDYLNDERVKAARGAMREAMHDMGWPANPQVQDDAFDDYLDEVLDAVVAAVSGPARPQGTAVEVDDEDLCERCAKVRYTEEMESGRQLCMRCCLIEMDGTIMAQEKELNTFGVNAVAACERQRLPAIMDDELSTAYNNGVTDCVRMIEGVAKKAGRAIQELSALSSGERAGEVTEEQDT